MSTRTRPGNRELRRCEDKALLCMKRGTKIPLGVRAKIPPRRLAIAAAARGLEIDPLGMPRPLEFGTFLARFGPLVA